MPLFIPQAWERLGEVTASTAIRTGVLSWEKAYPLLMFEYFISGYSNVAIGRLIVGPTAGLSETGTTFSNKMLSDVTSTNSVSIPGWPVFGGAADNVPRWGQMWVQNNPSVIKRMTGEGQNGGTAPTAAPTIFTCAGQFNDATNSIQRAELAVYDLITGAVISARTFNAGTYLRGWGCNL